MPPLPTDLRNQLSKAITAARREAEAGARTALQSLAVDRHEPHGSMTPAERALRNRLRARSRQLGDVRNTISGTQTIDRLTHEVAYEHWHRMLFARFLAENHLLIEPDSGVAITMDECEELAREAGEDPRALAARFAQRMLPQIFRTDDPVLEVTLAPETRQALERQLNALPAAVFTGDDALGWTYQFWQAEKKDQVNASGKKIGADELPAVTQLFTEHYMVLFLLHNTLGAWWYGKPPDSPLIAEWEYLRFWDDPPAVASPRGLDFQSDALDLSETGGRTGKGDRSEIYPTKVPCAGTFDGWPQTAAELKVLDPCCGSGHFLVEGFELLVRLRMEEEGLTLEDAIGAVLADNLFGLEIDPRCTQIAAFNVALAAWKLAGKPIKLPPLHIACSGLAPNATKEEWAKLAGDDDRLRNGMEWLYDLFEQAPELGSLIAPPSLTRHLFYQTTFTEMQPLLAQALQRERESDEQAERAVAAQGMARAAGLLAGKYHLAATNVPYLLRRKQGEALQEFCDRYHKAAKNDLATCFVQRSGDWCAPGGSYALLTPQNWLFLTTYRNMRQMLLKEQEWDVVARLGPCAFTEISGEVVRVTLLVLSNSLPQSEHTFAGLDASEPRTPHEKAAVLREGQVKRLGQAGQVGNPDARIALDEATDAALLNTYAASVVGMHTGDGPRLLREFWELPRYGGDWVCFQSSPAAPCLYAGRSGALCWCAGEGGLTHMPGARVCGQAAWSRKGILLSEMRSLPATLYTGEHFSDNTAAIVPVSSEHLPAIWAFCSSPEFNKAVRRIDQKLNVTNATLVKVPFDLDHWQKVAEEQYPDGLPEPYSDDPTQWLFHGHPAKAESPTILQVAVARLLGYRWPPELDLAMRLADEARDWTARCEPLAQYGDQDGIVCLSATRGESSGADRLRRLLAAAFGSEWSAARERDLLTVAGDGKKPADSLETWLRDRFFEEHCKLFHHRPFIWHLWDGNKYGFSALVNCHKLTGPDGKGRRTLESLTYGYLGDWIDRQKAEQREGKEGADGRLAAAQDLQGQLEKVLAGEPPYDTFVRWKPLHEQPLGWEPDLNDGVRLNIRPFLNATLRTGGRTGAGILRWKPNINWKKDRGKEPESLRPRADFPWFWSCPGDGTLDQRTDFAGGNEFDGNRWNDLHYTNDAKRAARERAAREGS